MSIEDFKNDMIESIEKRTASGVILMSKKSFMEVICAECAITMLYRNIVSDRRNISFDKMELAIEYRYGVPLRPFINAFDGDHIEEEWSPGLEIEMYNLGNEIKNTFNPMPYDEIYV